MISVLRYDATFKERKGGQWWEDKRLPACTRHIYSNQGETKKDRERNFKYVVFTVHWDEPIATDITGAIGVYADRTCESRGMKIYHTVFITVDTPIGSNYVWHVQDMSIFRGGDLSTHRRRSKKSVCNDQRHELRSTDVLLSIGINSFFMPNKFPIILRSTFSRKIAL